MNRLSWWTIHVVVAIGLVGGVAACCMYPSHGWAQETPPAQTLPPVEVEPPREAPRPPSQTSARSPEGFNYGQPFPQGQPFSDYGLSSGQAVSPAGRPTSLAVTPSSVSVIENQGVTSLGKGGLSDMLQGQPGLWSSGFAGNPFDSPIAIRGFASETVNRTSLLMDGTSLNIPRQEVNTNFIFPELIERVEVLRGDGTIQFGDKAIGGAVNVILKKPRLHPGNFFGCEAGSWGSNREWAGINIVRDAVALGFFLGRYAQEGWRIYYGANDWEEPFRRPGPWALMNVHGTLNWKVTPSVTLDVSHLISDQRTGNYNPVDNDRWHRRDTRDIRPGAWGSRPFDDPGEERRDNLTTVKLLYHGDRRGNVECTWTGRTYDRSIKNFFSDTVGSDQRWTDFSLYLKYTRTDEASYIRNDLTLAMDYADGRFVREVRQIQGSAPWALRQSHSASNHGDRGLMAYWLVNQTRLWERLVLGLGYRREAYELKDLYSHIGATNATVRGRRDMNKSASQYSVGFIYDTELGSNVYYRHARTYRFPNFDDMVNLTWGYIWSHPDPIWLLDPEDGTLEEVAIRHWFTRNVYAGVTYYELDMDSEIFYGPDPTDAWGRSRNLNVPNVAHSGVECELMMKLTPRWTVKANYTRQKVIFRENWQPTDYLRRSTADKWLPLNPAEMAFLGLTYENEEWGFSGTISYNYMGSRYLIDDVFNQLPDLEPVKTGDIAVSQKFWDGNLELYAGIRNFSDRQYAVQGRYDSWGTPPFDILRWTNAGRTYFFGMKSSLAFERMRPPSTDDLMRMSRRLYDVANASLGSMGRLSQMVGQGGTLWR